MNPPRRYRVFSHHGARYRISSPESAFIIEEIKRLRAELEAYITTDPAFRNSLVPVDVPPQAPPVAHAMAEAARAAGVGPMAAVAGAFAEAAARCALAAGAEEAIVDNGGDIFLASPRPVVTGVYAAGNPLSGQLAFLIKPEEMPIALCASSGVMGHSLSLGKCDLAVVASANAALADAAATLAANLVSTPADVEHALDTVGGIPGVSGVFILMGDAVGMTGRLPELVKHADPILPKKIPAHKSWRGIFSS
jgi:ApbE superfamily uncharacterized protein (UPF0280 family)